MPFFVYCFTVVHKKSITPSIRSELEITTGNAVYDEQCKLNVQRLVLVYVWPETETHDSIMEATQFLEIIERRLGFNSACLEEIACRNG